MPSLKEIGGVNQFHILLTTDEHRMLRVVAAEEGRRMKDIVHDLCMPEIERRYALIKGQDAAESQAAPKAKARASQ